MATIQSRAITLRFTPERQTQNDVITNQWPTIIEKNRPLTESDEEAELRQDLLKIFKENKGLGEIVEKLKTFDRSSQKDAYEFFLDLERNFIGSYEHKQKVLNALEWFQTSQAFNNPSAERFFNLINSLQNP